MNSPINKYLKYSYLFLYYALISYFTFLMVFITLQYIPIDFKAAFLNLKEEEIKLTHYQVAFFSHVCTSIFALITGITQFSVYIRNKYSQIHRFLGKTYILIVLLIASPSGLIMAYYANGGFYPQLSFSIQAILWFYFTYLAFKFAKSKQWTEHKNFMLRSFALTLSAISLRLIKLGIVSTIELPPMDTYRIVAWAGWLVNLMIVEIYIYYCLVIG